MVTRNGALAPVPFKRSGLVWTLYLLLGLFAFALTMIGPAIPYLRLEFHLDYTMAALHLSMFAVGMVVGGLLSPAILQRTGFVTGIWGGMVGIMAILLVTRKSLIQRPT